MIFEVVLVDVSPVAPYTERANQLARAEFHPLDATVRAATGRVFTSVALAILRGGECWLDAAWGRIDAEVPAHPDLRFDLASVSKLFTTSAFLSLVSAGAVDLDAPLVTVVPEFGVSGPRPLDGGQDPHTRAMFPVPAESLGQTADPARVTFRQLLTHTSGLAPWRAVFEATGPVPPPPADPDPLPRAVRWRRALDAISGYPFVGQPGDGSVRYSDLGLMLLGEALARLHGTPGDLVPAIQARVLAPLGLRTITYNPLQHGLAQADVAPTEFDALWRHRRCWGEVHDENACGVGGVAGHAGLFGTARELAAFGQAWLDVDPRLRIAPDLLRAATQTQAETDGVRRGLGWLLQAAAGAPCGDRFSPDAYGHTGFTGTSLWIDPARRLVVACLTNRVFFGRDDTGIRSFRRTIHDLIVKAVEIA